MKKLLASAALLLVLAGAGLFAVGRLLGVGPFALGAPSSWLYLAVARGGPEGEARAIEVIDAATGERRIFELDERAFDLALSPDRRTLYAGSAGGRILELDATRGTPLGDLRLSTSGEVRRLVALPDGRRLVAVSAVALESIVTVVDLASRRETGSLELGLRIAGRPLVRGAELLLPTADRAGIDTLLTVSLEPLRVREEARLSGSEETRLFTVQTAPAQVALRPDGAVVVLSPFRLRISVLGREGESRRDVDLSRLYFAGRTPTTLGLGFDGDLELSLDGSAIHACVGSGVRAERYRLGFADLEPQRVGGECGRLQHGVDGTIYLAVRGRPELKLVDPSTGAVRRTLPLTGYPQRLVN